MAGGWGNPLMRNQAEFMVFDGTMIAIACILMTIAHPGIFFPSIGSYNRKTIEETRSTGSPDPTLQSTEIPEKH